MQFSNLTGNLLIAPPYVKGNFWYKTVIMVAENHSKGSIGLVLNKKSPMSINELGEKLDLDVDIPGFVYIGGPLSRNSLSMIHTNDWQCQHTLQLNKTFSISSSPDIVSRLALGDCPHRWRLVFGLCGWAAGQLDLEIKGESPFPNPASWCVATASVDLVFESDSKHQWATALEQSADDFASSIVF